jgi:hypothetical protein
MKKFDLLIENVLNGIGKNKTIADICKKHNVSEEDVKKSLKFGTNKELEHSKNDPKTAKTIAMDHLWEFGPDYYLGLDKLEKTLKK